MRRMFLDILIKSNLPIAKAGSHTIRHSIATFIVDKFSNPMLVQKFLSHTNYKMSQKYVHQLEERKAQLPSPLKLMGADLKDKSFKPSQIVLITDGISSDSTALIPINPAEIPIEKVEGTIDLTDQMFPIPEKYNGNKRFSVNFEEFCAVVTLARFDARQAPQLDPIPGILMRMEEQWNHYKPKS